MAHAGLGVDQTFFAARAWLLEPFLNLPVVWDRQEVELSNLPYFLTDKCTDDRDEQDPHGLLEDGVGQIAMKRSDERRTHPKQKKSEEDEKRTKTNSNLVPRKGARNESFNECKQYDRESKHELVLLIVCRRRSKCVTHTPHVQHRERREHRNARDEHA